MIRAPIKTFILAGLLIVASIGAACAESDGRDVVRDSRGQIVHLNNGTCVRTMWMTGEDACGPKRMAQAMVTNQRQETRRAAALTQEERTVYFAFDSAALAPEARQRLDTLANALKSNDEVKEAAIVGYADRIGSASYNEKLSQKRAEAVRDYLIANGYTNARVTETHWVGKSKPSTSCPAEKRPDLIACLQNDRRVEVGIVLQPDQSNGAIR